MGVPASAHRTINKPSDSLIDFTELPLPITKQGFPSNTFTVACSNQEALMNQVCSGNKDYFTCKWVIDTFTLPISLISFFTNPDAKTGFVFMVPTLSYSNSFNPWSFVYQIHARDKKDILYKLVLLWHTKILVRLIMVIVLNYCNVVQFSFFSVMSTYKHKRLISFNKRWHNTSIMCDSLTGKTYELDCG